MQLALEALEKVITAFGSGLTLQQNAINALRQALETEREWVGLTAYEIQEIHSGNQHWGNFACAIEAKLKEKNHG